MDPKLQESAGNFVLQLISEVQQLHARSDTIEHAVQQLADSVEQKGETLDAAIEQIKALTMSVDEIQAIKVDKTMLDERDARAKGEMNEFKATINQELQRVRDFVASLTVTELAESISNVNVSLEERINSVQSAAEQLAVLVDAKANEDYVQELATIVKENQDYINQMETQLVTAIDSKANHVDAFDSMERLAAVVDEKEEKALVQDLLAKVEAVTGEVGNLNELTQRMEHTKANTALVNDHTATLNAKANKQDLRRFLRGQAFNSYRSMQRTFSQTSGRVVHDYRVPLVMDVGFRYKLELTVQDHNRQVGEFIEAAVALLPLDGLRLYSAWMNCDWGTGKGWAIDGQKPGVGLMNLHGQHKSAIFTTGDIVDITLDHHIGQHMVEFSKRGSEIRCRRQVAPGAVNLVISLFGKAGLEITDFDMID